jgi:hypothetical protein
MYSRRAQYKAPLTPSLSTCTPKSLNTLITNKYTRGMGRAVDWEEAR